MWRGNIFLFFVVKHEMKMKMNKKIVETIMPLLRENNEKKYNFL